MSGSSVALRDPFSGNLFAGSGGAKASVTPLAGRRAALIGDSITGQNHDPGSADSGDIDQEARGWFTWVQVKLGYPFVCHVREDSSSPLSTGVTGGNFAEGGNTTANVVSDLDLVAGYNPDISFIHVGTNDVVGGVAYATIVANLETIYKRLLGYGPVVAIPILPRNAVDGASNFTADQKLLHFAVNQWIAEYCSITPGMIYVDISRLYTNTGEMKTGYTVDSVHTGVTGAWYISECVIAAIQDFAIGYYSSPASPYHIYNATYAPHGNRLDNPDFSGTGGTKSGAGTLVGNVPDDWTLEINDADITATLSTVSDPNGFFGDFLRINLAIAGSGSGTSNIRFRQTGINSGFAENDEATGGCLINVGASAGSTDLLDEIYLKVWESAGGNHSIVLDNDTSDPLVDTAWKGMLRTDPCKSSGSPSYRWEFYAYVDLTGAADNVNIDIGRPWLGEYPITPVIG